MSQTHNELPRVPGTTFVDHRRVPLDELSPYPGNAKRGDVPTILESLRRNGQYRGIVVREIPAGPLVVLAGNHTVQALQLHGRGPCDIGKADPGQCCICRGGVWDNAARCEIVTCDDGTARRVNLADNRTAERGDYDRDALADLVAALAGDYAGTGYTEADIELLTAPPLDLDALADQYGEPDHADLWPVLRIKVSPQDRDRFYALTEGQDDDARFRLLLDRASAGQGAPAEDGDEG